MAVPTASRTISAIGIRSVVRAGTVWAAMRMSSKPTTDSRSGTDAPIMCAAWSTPMATRSVDVQTGGRRLGQLEQGAQRLLAAGERVLDALEVAVGHAAEALGHELDVGVLALPEVALQVGAHERDPPMAQVDDVVEAGPDAGPVVGLGGRELERAGALPHGHDRHGRAPQVVEQARLVLHVAEQHDGVGVAGLEDRGQRDALVEPALGVAEDDVVAVAHRLDREGLDGAGEERVAEVAHDRPDEHRRGAAQARAPAGLGR